MAVSELAFEPPHPGEYLREDILPALRMSADDFAAHLQVAPAEISNLLEGRTGVTTDMAVRLGQALRNGARFWLALQMQRDLWTAERMRSVHVRALDWTDEDDAA